MTLLVLGSTGTLGRQIVRRALSEGFQVKCFVRSFKKAAFLKEWGAELIYGDLKVPESIPIALYGITGIIDASTTRPSDFYAANLIELESKKILIKAAVEAKIKRYVFFSIFNARNYRNISLMNLKAQTEDELRNSHLAYTIFSLCGFFQGLIQQYAIPILDNQSIWITQESQSIPYIDTQDIARLAIKSLSIPATKNRTFALMGGYSWTSFEIIELCEKLAGQKSKISIIPPIFLQFLRKITRVFQWSWNISERLAFASFLIEQGPLGAETSDFYDIFHINSSDFKPLEEYLEEYFSSILKKVEELNEQKQSINILDSF